MVAFMKTGAGIDEMGVGDELRPKMEGDERENAADEGPDDGREGETMIGAFELGGDEDDGDEGRGAVNNGVGLVELRRGTCDGGGIDERLKTSQIKAEGAV